jgi:predicted DCC family thiol-disulfide oxidoreductase YuxK
MASQDAHLILVWIILDEGGAIQHADLMKRVTESQGTKVGPPMLVYDGSCGFCSRSVQFILRHERRHDLLFVPRDSELGISLRRTYAAETIESMLWIEAGRVFAASDSVIRAAEYLGGWWSRLGDVASLCPSSLLNLAYKLVATNRRRFMSNPATCLVPTPEQRSRFLD